MNKMTKVDRNLTLKQETAVQEYILNGGNKSDAYREAYNVENMADTTIHRKAHELFSYGKITARIDELRLENRNRNNISIDLLTQELDEARELARQTANPSAMNQATMAKAKLHGLLVDKQAHTNADGSPMDTIWTVSVMK